MSRSDIILATLLVYGAAMLLLGLWAARRTRSTDDFYLAGRRLGPVLAALSASASSSSAWTLLGVSGAAYAWGFKAVWLFPATVGGFVVNWLWVAPRLRRLAQANGALTLTEVLIAGHSSVWARRIARSAALIILVSFMFYVSAQLQGAGLAFSTSLDISADTAVAIGAVTVLIYTLLGGFWAASATDALQGIFMAATAIFLPAFALHLAGGWGPVWASLTESAAGGVLLTGEESLLVGALFVLGTLGIGLGYPGQPHVVNRFMALKSDRALAQARVMALLWAVVVYGGMLLLGWAVRLLALGPVSDSERIMLDFALEFLPTAIGAVAVTAVLSAIVSTADSQLLVAGSAVSHDWGLPDVGGRSIAASRVIVGVLTLLALVLALGVPESIFSRVLFAWHAIGAAFGPPLLVMLLGRRTNSLATFLAINTGFAATVILHWLPDSPGDILERGLPFVLSLGLVLLGSRRTGPA
ncbi:sodium/proline symporter [Candidatus Rariloculus sp.]|uniref:sodium/proline symporter n=1 Tax=Candidatus Rariloculus sp. TaxID=3101265 RepID=UPI003D0D8842